jgi:hypothetical protein
VKETHKSVPKTRILFHEVSIEDPGPDGQPQSHGLESDQKGLQILILWPPIVTAEVSHPRRKDLHVPKGSSLLRSTCSQGFITLEIISEAKIESKIVSFTKITKSSTPGLGVSSSGGGGGGEGRGAHRTRKKGNL